MTATQFIIQALAEKAAITVDHETKSFIGFRFRLSNAERDTVVRVHRARPEAAAMLEASAQ